LLGRGAVAGELCHLGVEQQRQRLAAGAVAALKAEP
jgi:hypothetical protein